VSLDLLVSLAERFTTRAHEISLNGSVLLFTVAIATLTGVLVGALPALPGRGSLGAAIQEGGRTVSGGRGTLPAALIVAQVAVSFVLLIGAGLMLRSLWQLQSVDAGIKTDSVITMRVALNFSKYTTPESRRQFAAPLVARLRDLPGVRSVAGAGTFPLNEGGGFTAGVRIQGQPEVDPARLPRAQINAVTPGYFQTVGIPLIRGRLIDDRDLAGREQVAVISDSMAKQFFAGSDPVGARLSTNNGQQWVTIVGVVGDVRNRLDAAPAAAFYRPLDQAPLQTMMFLVRAAGEAAALTPLMRQAVYAIDPQQAADQFRTLDAVRSTSLAAPRLTATLIGVFAAIALVITAIGLAGVIAFSVNQRAQEFGVRLALGATPGAVRGLVLSYGARLVAIGLAIGAAAALMLSGTVRTLLFETATTDPLTYAAVAALLAAVALAACLMPARRAAATNPLVVLKG
jgi:putative ABC transport system permease protein